jgi:non-heme Fe2+,alpha-ketoglutarate-dependent halogenase
MAFKTEFVPGDNDLRDLTFRPADPTDARTLSREQVETFNRDGFVSRLPAFSADEILDLKHYVDDLIERVVSAPDRRNSYSVTSYHLVCERLYDLMLTPLFLDYAEDLIGPDIVCWGMHLFAKMPGDGMEVPLHQDARYWPLTPAKSVTVWLAIDDADEENAAMEFTPGSHALGALPHEEKALDGSRVLKHAVVDPESYGPRYVNTLQAGQVSLHSDLLLHGSRANLSTRRRSGLTIRYTAAEVAPLPGEEWYISPTVHCRGTIPDRWPNCARPVGEHPEFMAGITGDFDGNPPAGGHAR